MKLFTVYYFFVVLVICMFVYIAHKQRKDIETARHSLAICESEQSDITMLVEYFDIDFDKQGKILEFYAKSKFEEFEIKKSSVLTHSFSPNIKVVRISINRE